LWFIARLGRAGLAAKAPPSMAAWPAAMTGQRRDRGSAAGTGGPARDAGRRHRRGRGRGRPGGRHAHLL